MEGLSMAKVREKADTRALACGLCECFGVLGWGLELRRIGGEGFRAVVSGLALGLALATLSFGLWASRSRWVWLIPF